MEVLCEFAMYENYDMVEYIQNLKHSHGEYKLCEDKQLLGYFTGMDVIILNTYDKEGKTYKKMTKFNDLSELKRYAEEQGLDCNEDMDKLITKLMWGVHI